jgi:anthranilate synthase component 1
LRATTQVGRYGGIRLPDFFTVERYSHVMHIVSRVEGELRPGQSALDALAACFPAGTVSGAPKVRAMEIIDNLERSARDLYAGAVGYLDYYGNLDTCIAIRTLVFAGGQVRAQAGAGIVADSVPRTERQETLNKARALMEALHGD